MVRKEPDAAGPRRLRGLGLRAAYPCDGDRGQGRRKWGHRAVRAARALRAHRLLGFTTPPIRPNPRPTGDYYTPPLRSPGRAALVAGNVAFRDDTGVDFYVAGAKVRKRWQAGMSSWMPPCA